TQLPFSNLHLYFMLGLTQFLGFLPSDNFSKGQPFFDLREGMFVPEQGMHGYFLPEEMSRIIHQFLNSEWTKIHEIKINRATRKELLRKMIIFYRLHIENFPDLNSHQILEEVLE
ncbi:MAG: DNA repair protein RecO C-terminal domain-containing protein, partial [Bacteroidota bacterium]